MKSSDWIGAVMVIRCRILFKSAVSFAVSLLEYEMNSS